MTVDEVCIIVDGKGEIVGIERGDAADIPDDIRFAGAALLAAQVPHRRDFYYWKDASPSFTLRVSLERITVGSDERVAIVTQRAYELPSGLTRRELDVLTEITQGKTNAEVATALGMSERTVSTHVLSILRKLGIGNRTMAALVAVERGLLRGSSPTTDLAPSIAAGSAAATPLRYTKTPLVIGTALPLVGIASEDARDMMRGSILAIEEVNARGGVHGRKLALEIEAFDILDPDDVARALRALADRGADVITSGYLADQSVAHETAADLRLPYLHASASGRVSERVEADPERYRYVFQVCPSDSAYAPQFVRQMTQLRESGLWTPRGNTLTVIDSVWVASSREPTTQIGIVDAAAVAEGQRWQLGVMDGADFGHDFRAAGRRVAAQAPAAALIGHFLVPGVVEFLRGFLEAPSETLLYGIYAPSVRAFREQLGDAADGLMWATLTGTYSDAFGSRFLRSFMRRFDDIPGRSHAGTAYDRIHLAANAWMELDNPRDSDDFARALRGDAFRGVNGVYHLATPGQTAFTFADFDEAGGEATRDPSIAQAHLVFQIQDGRQRILAPSAYADGVFRLPPWFAHGTTDV